VADEKERELEAAVERSERVQRRRRGAKDRSWRAYLKDRAAFRSRRKITDRRRKRLAEYRAGKGAPRIVTSAQMGLTFSWVFGAKGTPAFSTGHYAAGPRAKNEAELKLRMRSFHVQHASQGWGGGSYDVVVADDGTLGLLNPIGRKGAHVAGKNTGNVGINCPGTTGDKMTAEQERTIRWYIENAHTAKLPAAYRSPRPLGTTQGGVHRDYNPTACPGDMTPQYRKVLP
jgi:hypothetical protein